MRINAARSKSQQDQQVDVERSWCFRSLHRNGVNLLVGTFDTTKLIILKLRVCTQALFSGPYTVSQLDLFGQVLALRELQHLTFTAIACQLTASSYLTPRGCALSGELVFSIYKKGKRRLSRLSEVGACWLPSITIN
jgi:hypothetical protein